MLESRFIAGTAAQLSAEYGLDLNGAPWGVVEFQGDVMDDGTGFETRAAIEAEFSKSPCKVEFL